MKKVLLLIENSEYLNDVRVRQEATSLVNAGYQVCVISPTKAGHPWHENIKGVRVFRYPYWEAGSHPLAYALEYAYSLIATFFLSILVWIRFGFDIIHAANPPDQTIFIGLFYKVFGKKFIFDHHDLSPELYDAKYGDKSNRFIRATLVWLEKLSCRFSDHIIATNQSYKVVEMQRDKVSGDRITIVRNGPDLGFLKPVEPDSELRQKAKTILVYVGIMGFQDGVDHLIRALNLLVNKLGKRDFLCVIVGTGDASSSVKSMADQLGLNDNILFTGWVQPDQVACYISTADIGVAPEPSDPLNDRSTIIKIMEYMTLGKPVVAFDLPEHRVTADGACLFAQPNDALDFAAKIAELMDNPDLQKRLGQIGSERIKNELAWSHQEKYLLEAYKALTHS